MSNTKIEQTGQFIATDTAGGTHAVTEFTTFIEHAPIDGPVQWIRGLKAYKLSGGSHLNVKSEDTFEDIRTGQILTRGV